MKNYYCLGTSDTTTENAIDILKRRLHEKKYPLYKKTPFLKDIKKDDEVVFYVAGKKNKSQKFIVLKLKYLMYLWIILAIASLILAIVLL